MDGWKLVVWLQNVCWEFFFDYIVVTPDIYI